MKVKSEIKVRPRLIPRLLDGRDFEICEQLKKYESETCGVRTIGWNAEKR